MVTGPKSSCELLVDKTWPLSHHSRTGQTLHICPFTSLLLLASFDVSFATTSWRKMVKLGALMGTGNNPEKAANSSRSGGGVACSGIAWTSTHSPKEEGSCKNY